MTPTNAKQKGSALIGALVLVILSMILLPQVLNFSFISSKESLSASIRSLNLAKAEELNNLLLRGLSDSKSQVKLIAVSGQEPINTAVCTVSLCRPEDEKSCLNNSWLKDQNRIQTQVCYGSNCVDKQSIPQIESEIISCVSDAQGSNVAFSVIALDTNKKIIFEKHN